jgi:hypothetical protein
MDTTDIWKNLNFPEKNNETAYTKLINQSDTLYEKTQRNLKIEVEAIDTYIDIDDEQKLGALYMLYVVAPKLGNFRRKILTVLEFNEIGRFPVEIICNMDNDRIINISEENFLNEVEKVLTKTIVKNSIETLYFQSKEIDN